MSNRDSHHIAQSILATGIVAVAHGNMDCMVRCLDLSSGKQELGLTSVTYSDGDETVQEALERTVSSLNVNNIIDFPIPRDVPDALTAFRQCPLLVLVSPEISDIELMVKMSDIFEYWQQQPFVFFRCNNGTSKALPQLVSNAPLSSQVTDMIDKIKERFALVFNQLKDDRKCLKDISVFVGEEYEEIVGYKHQTTNDIEVQQSIANLFREKARQFSDLVALQFGEYTQTYKALLEKGEKIASTLRLLGVQPGDTVGIYADRSPAAIEAIVGTVLAGGVYVPLSPEWPDARIQSLALKTNLSAVLVACDLAFPVEGIASASVFDIRPDAERYQEIDCRSGDDRLYILFTSGSTGTPKGVEVPHRGVTRLVYDRKLFPIESGQRVMHGASLGFDASTLEIWLPLLNGAIISGFTKEEILEARLLRHARQIQPLNYAFFTITLFESLLEHAPDILAGIDNIYTGGEAIRASTMAGALAVPGMGRLVACYGPTEATVFALTMDICSQDLTKDIVAIGRPIANTSVYILDQHQRILPSGIPGEIYLGGDGLALGYLGDPELTVARFVSNSFVDGQLYRTGDLGSQRRDGIVDFIGRMDRQVKVRGHRIELGEIENVLEKFPSIDRALVRIHEPSQGDRRLVAWVRSKANSQLDKASLSLLEEELRSILPDFMIPSWFIPVDSFKITANGKTDLTALPDPEVKISPELGIDAKNPLPGVLNLFQRHLVNSDFSCADNFLASGGDSLLAIRLVQQIRNQTGIAPLVSLFFESRTAEIIADYIRLAVWKKENHPPISNKGTFIQEMRF